MNKGFFIYVTTIIFLTSLSFNLVNSIAGNTGPNQEAVLEAETAGKAGGKVKRNAGRRCSVL